MGFLSLIIALLLEQVRPLQSDNPVYAGVRSISAKLERSFNAGEKQQGIVAWLLLVLPLTLGTWLIFYLLVRAHPFLGLGWNVLVLYLTLGFRQFSHHYTDIQVALANNDLAQARLILTRWKLATDPGFSALESSTREVSRIAIEEALLASHRHVFGVLFWFVVLPGPSGAVMYRLAEHLARSWGTTSARMSNATGQTEPFGDFSQRIFLFIDWVPVRLSAIGFAVVGNFEDAIFCWRNYSQQWTDPSRGIILAAGAGALGVRLGDTRSFTAGAVPNASVLQPAGAPVEPIAEAAGETMPGVDASPAAMRSAVGLVWRSMVLWLILLLLLSLGGLFG